MLVLLAWAAGLGLTELQQHQLTAGSPVGKVVALLEDLQKVIAEESKREQQVYDKYACWCETTSQRKADAIDQAKADIRTLSNEILGLKGQRASLAGEIEGIASDIEDNERSSESLTQLRQHQFTDDRQETSSMQHAVGALETLVTFMKAGHLGLATKNAQVKAAASTVVGLVKDEHVAKQLQSFLQDGEEPAAFDAFSPKVTDILTAMYTTFKANLLSAEQNEASAKMTFTSVLEGKEGALQALRDAQDVKEQRSAEVAAELAKREQAILDLEEQMDDDKVFFNETRDECEDEADEYNERLRRRSEENEGISQALELLSSDANRATFEKAFSLLQLSSVLSSVSARTAKAGRLAILQPQWSADSDRFAAAHDFDAGDYAAQKYRPVLRAIKQMKRTIDEEEAEDIAQRDWCRNETHNNTLRKDLLLRDINVLNNKVEKLEAENTDINAQVLKTENLMAELAAELAQEDQLRAEANAAYLEAKAQDEAAISVLNQTIYTLEAFFRNNSADGQLTQAQPSLVQVRRQPEFAISEDQAPDKVSAGGQYQGAGKQTDVILGLLNVIMEDLQTQVSKANATETQSAADHQAYQDTANETNTSLAATRTSLLQDEAENLGFIQGHTAINTSKTAEVTATSTYLTSIFPNCNWIEGSYDLRHNRRAAERVGLTDAESLLAGGKATGLAATHKAVKHAEAAKSSEISVATASTQALLDSLDDDYKDWSVKARRATLFAKHDQWVTHRAPKVARKAHAPPAAAPKAKAFLAVN